ncbi:MAG: adenosyl-hopene transferase HpnH [Planctomycetaceae bacterium]|nr:adenosyl-hopene transferase HpnH [Planctomycetaceae bacterium]
MRFPFSLSSSLFLYMFRMKLRGREKYPMVLMLEPLHACNLRCNGCGRIREYADTINKRMSLDECLAAVDECPAPVVSVCGGEPLIYPEITELLDGILTRKKHIYLCTNGVLLEEKLEKIVAIRSKRLKTRLYWNVHLDGPQSVHDAIVGQSGVFQKAIRGITAAKQAGFRVYTNTTLYKQTTVEQLIELAEILTPLKIDGIMLAPGFGYESVGNESFFLTRDETYEKFREIRAKMSKYRITTTPIFMDFLCGERQLSCAAYANPTRNIAGWKGPCYLITDKHHESYHTLINETDWTKYGFENDPRCEHCLSHCGFEPAAVFACKTLADGIRMGLWQWGWRNC